MFTGIISNIGIIHDIHPREDGVVRVGIKSDFDTSNITLGASIAHNGICLTVIETGNGDYVVELGAETLALTNAKDWQVGTRLNLERALKMGDELGGHMVTGHVDSIARIVSAVAEQGCWRYHIEAPDSYARFIAPKGCVALDGISLTVNSVNGNVFDVCLIPHTLANTTAQEWQSGSRLHLEIDLMARYAARLMAYTA